MKHAAVLAVCSALLAGLVACPLARSAKPEEKATAKSSKDIAACERMCEVAGDAEDNKAAVNKCKKKCQD